MKLLVDFFVESHGGRAPAEPLVLDIDATADLAHGNQERNFFHGFHGGYCFLPLYIFCGERILIAWLRPSSRSGAYNARAALAVVVGRLRHHWPDVEVVVRADSGFATPKILDWCDAEGVGYLIGVAKNSRLDTMLADHLEQARIRAERTGRPAGRPARVFTSFRYQARSWPRRRRIVAKAEWTGDKANPRYVVTTLRGRARELYEDRYCARGDMENRIKEQQYGLFSDRTSCHRFRANQLRVAMSAAAYVLLEHVRRVGLKGTEMARAQAWTIRERLFKVAAKITISARRVRVQISETWPRAAVLHRAIANLPAGRRLRRSGD